MQSLVGPDALHVRDAVARVWPGARPLPPYGADIFIVNILGLTVLRDLHLTVVMVTHDMHTLFALTERIAVLACQTLLKVGFSGSERSGAKPERVFSAEQPVDSADAPGGVHALAQATDEVVEGVLAWDEAP